MVLEAGDLLLYNLYSHVGVPITVVNCTCFIIRAPSTNGCGVPPLGATEGEALTALLAAKGGRRSAVYSGAKR